MYTRGSVWLDGLDIPMVAFFDAGFAERYTEPSQPLTRPDGDALLRYGENMLPLEFAPATATTPLFSYPYARSRIALDGLRSQAQLRSDPGLIRAAAGALGETLHLARLAELACASSSHPFLLKRVSCSRAATGRSVS